MWFQQRGSEDVGWFLILRYYVRPKCRKIGGVVSTITQALGGGCFCLWLDYLQLLSSVEHTNEMESIRKRKVAIPTSATTNTLDSFVSRVGRGHLDFEGCGKEPLFFDCL